MAKFPFLSLESDCVDMGDVVVGQTAEAFVRFGNHSPVPANFFLAAGPGSHDGAISVQPMRYAVVWYNGSCDNQHVINGQGLWQPSALNVLAATRGLC